ncbi:MAG: TonB-dependent receptor [Opitutaceae bacterium]|nr:TonB-dependent receptor [Opitutaceae bacterium]
MRGELFVYDARSETRREKPAVDGQDEFYIHAGIDNPFNPFGSRFYHPTGAPNPDGTRRLVGKRNRLPFVRALDLSAAVRTERFSTAGTATKPKVAVAYRPSRTLLFRGSYNQSFRAPNLVQTNTQPLQRNGASADPYRADVTPLLTDDSSNRTNLRIGNENLTPEESDTWTAGLVVEVPFVKGLSMTFDYFELKQRGVVGRAVIITENYINLAGRDVRGWEASMQYRFPRTRLGRFSLRSDVTYALRFKTKENPGSNWESSREENGRPKWRATASLAWRQGGWFASWFTNYAGEFVDTSAATTAAVWQALGYPDYIRHYDNDGLDRYYFRVEPAISHTVNVGYEFSRPRGWLRHTSVRAGVSNVLGAEPPFLDNTTAGSTGTIASRGRTYTTHASKRF